MLLAGMMLNPDEYVVSSLTEYEIGNVLWRENKKKKLKNPVRIAEIFSETIGDFRKIGIDSIVKVLTIAIERDLTFYDASYAYIAEKEKIKLVTEDADLLQKCKFAINIKDVEGT